MENINSTKRWYKRWWVIILIIIIIIPTTFILLVMIALKIFCSLPIPKNIPNEMKNQISASCSGQISQIQSKPINTLPMYGEVEKTEAQKKTDAEFINSIIREIGNQKDGSVFIASKARELFKQGDLDTAMKRYNQAWLLDNKNPDVYIGFGDILKKQGQEENAIEMYKKAEELKELKLNIP